MITNEQIIDALTEAIEYNRENKICCNNALGWARGRLRVLDDEIATKNEEIAKLQARVAELESCRKDDVTDDDWVACSERLPEIGKEVMIQMTNPLLLPKIGYLGGDGKSWWVIMSAQNGAGKISGDAVIAWRELPKRYEPPVVEEEPVVEKPKRGDCVLCKAISLEGEVIRGVLIGEDYHGWWITTSDCNWPRCLSKEHYVLIKTGKHIDIFEEELSEIN